MNSPDELMGHVIKETYRIDSFLGEGGPSIVYRGTDLLLDVPVAIKRLKRTPTMQDGSSLAERFLREGRTQARLVHQNIVGIRAVLEENDEYYIVMEFIEGLDLSQVLALWPKQQLSFSLTGSIFTQILSGLGYAHESGVIHRDIKPSNILVDQKSRSKIADFGIARVVTDSRLTQTGYLIGTVAYMSPEQLKGIEVDHRADIYSLGVTLFEALAGMHPFRLNDDEVGGFEMMSRHIYEQPPSLTKIRPSISSALEEVVLRAMAKEPDARFPDCIAFTSALKQALASSGTTISDSTQVISIYPSKEASVLSKTSEALEPSVKKTASKAGIGLPKASEESFVDPLALPDMKPEEKGRGTGAFDREQLEHLSEERPSGVLVSISSAIQDPRLVAEGALQDTPAQMKNVPVQGTSTSEQHDLGELEEAKPLQVETGSFFREDVPRGTGVFDREAKLAIEQSTKHSKKSPVQRTMATPVPLVGDFDAPTTPMSTDAYGQVVYENAPDEDSSSFLGGTGLMLSLLFAGILVGGGLFYWLISPPAPKNRESLTKKDAHNTQTIPDAQTVSGDRAFVPKTAIGSIAPSKVAIGSRDANQNTNRNAVGTCPMAYGEMVFVQGGRFGQGSRRKQRRSDHPFRRVSISSFCIDRFEVTAASYRDCVQRGQCSRPKRHSPSRQPVRFVTWMQANMYCRAVHKRLPKEAEWEYALRHQVRTKNPWGRRRYPRCSQVHWRKCHPHHPLAPNEKKRSINGIHDLLGNVWEWVHDCYHPRAYQKTASVDPLFDRVPCRFRVLRGGSYRSGVSTLQPYYRSKKRPKQFRLDIGFRCASRPIQTSSSGSQP